MATEDSEIEIPLTPEDLMSISNHIVYNDLTCTITLNKVFIIIYYYFN